MSKSKLIPYKDTIIDRYLSGESCEKIGKDFNVGYWSVRRLLKQYNIIIRTHLDIAANRRIYSVNENYFDEIDDEYKAYWLGFLAADGGVTGKYRLKINLKYDDYDHLYKFKKHIEASNFIEYYHHPKKHPLVRLTITSKSLVESLAKYSIIPNKTYIVKPPNLSQDLILHYWRGVFDGDGCISKTLYNSYYTWVAHYCGNKYMVESFRDWIASHGIKPKKISKHLNSFQINYRAKKDFLKITTILYQGANVYLDRKYSLYLRAHEELSGDL